MRIPTAFLLTFVWLAGTASAYNWISFTVARHTQTTLSGATFDAALTDVNVRMRLDNHRCSDDTPCTAQFFRDGDVGVFGTSGDGLDNVDTQAKLDSVFAVNGWRAKVVTSLSRCAGTINPSFIGCGRCDGFGFILEDWVQGNVHVHEFGHNVLGCGHRDDCAWNIMNAVSNGQNDSVNSSECSGFGGKAYVQLCGNVYDGSGGPLTAAGGPYWVTCDVAVPAGQTLTVNAGVEIQFHLGTKITSSGSLNADGSTSRIQLYSNSQTLGFPSIKVNSQLQIANGGQLNPH